MRFPIGSKVRTIMGVRLTGKVIPRFYGPFTDGQYRNPYDSEKSEAVFIEWEDNTKGWILARFIKLVHQTRKLD
jgi:lipocalin